MSLITSIFHFPPPKPDGFAPQQDASQGSHATAESTASGSASSSRSSSNSFLRAFQEIRNASWSFLSSLASRSFQQSARPDVSESNVTGVRWKPRNFEIQTLLAEGIKPQISWPIESGRCADAFQAITNSEPGSTRTLATESDGVNEYCTAMDSLESDNDLASLADMDEGKASDDYDGASAYWSDDGDAVDLLPDSSPDTATSQGSVTELPKDPLPLNSLVTDWFDRNDAQRPQNGANHLPWIDPRGPIDV